MIKMSELNRNIEKRLHKILWESNTDLAEKCLNHPFVIGLADGSLEQNAFRIYVAQDAFYLNAFIKAYALALAKCMDIERIEIFHRFIGGIMDELSLHREYSNQLGINLKRVEPLSACRAYTDFLLRIAWQRDVDIIVSAMAPCVVLYYFIGTKLAKRMNPKTDYINWIKTYSSDSMRKFADETEALLDSVAKDSKEVRDVYRYAMSLEYDFFDEPLRYGEKLK